MKKCPYCAELIQEEAIKCRFCGSDLRAAPDDGPTTPTGSGERSSGLSEADTSPGPFGWPGSPRPEAEQATHATATGQSGGAQVGEGALRFSHSGYRYILGYDADHFGIWDRSSPGGPSLRFPRTDDGWLEAWNRFSALEPRAMAVPTTGTPAPDLMRAPTGRYRSAGRLGSWVVGLLAVAALLTLLVIAFRFDQLSLLRQMRDQGVESVSLAQRVASDDRVTAASVALLVVSIGLIVMWCVWQHRAQGNLRALGAANLRFTPGWAVGWWFIPFANIVMPYLAMRELSKASDPEGGSVGWQMARSSPLLPLWWGVLLASIALGSVGSALAAGGDSGAALTISETIAVEGWSIAGQFASVIAAILAVLLVRRIVACQEAKAARLRQWTSQAPVGGSSTWPQG